MPKFTLRHLYEIAPSIHKVASPEPKTLDIYTAFKLTQFVEAVQKQLATSDKLRSELFKRHAVGDKIPDEAIGAAQAELDEMLDAEVVLPNVEPPIKLEKLEKVGLGPLDLINLGFMLNTEEIPDNKE